MRGTPASDRRSTTSIFRSVGMNSGSIWNPSRVPTSQIVTRAGSFMHPPDFRGDENCSTEAGEPIERPPASNEEEARMNPNLGITDKDRSGVVKILNTLLADEYVLYTKTRNYHWNVVGSDFGELHKFFGQQYAALDDFVDDVAERARSPGRPPPSAPCGEFCDQSRLKEQPGDRPAARGMLENLLADHEAIIRRSAPTPWSPRGQASRRRHERLLRRPHGEPREDGVDAPRLPRGQVRPLALEARVRWGLRGSGGPPGCPPPSLAGCRHPRNDQPVSVGVTTHRLRPFVEECLHEDPIVETPEPRCRLHGRDHARRRVRKRRDHARPKRRTDQGHTAPSIAETKAIAEEGFIYGLPIVMNYAVMYEYAVDKNSGQFKAPFNQINNEARVFTYKDTAIVTPNSDTPYSIVWMDLRAEPMVLSVPAVEKSRYYSVHALRRQHLQLRLHRQPRHRQRGRRLPGGRPRLEGRDTRRHQEGVPLHARSSRSRSIARSSSIRPTCPTWSRSRPATRCSRCRPI